MVINPDTGRKIMKGTRTYLRLLKQGKISEEITRKEIKPKTMPINPETGRRVIVGTRTYEKLVKEGTIEPIKTFIHLMSRGVQTEPCNEFPLPLRQLPELPSGKMSCQCKGELINNVSRLQDMWTSFKQVNPRELSPETRLYLIDMVDTCVYFCQKNGEHILALCGDDIFTERIFNYIKSLRVYNPTLNRIKRYLQEKEGKLIYTELNTSRRKIPKHYKKVLRKGIK